MSFTLFAITQAGRLQYEALLLAASLRVMNPGFSGRLILGQPEPGPLWPRDPRIHDRATLALLADLGAEILPFHNRHFGASYPQGNKIEALSALPEGPFLFLDTDTLVTGPLDTLTIDFTRPSASMRRTATWPKIAPGGPDLGTIWGALYRRFGLDMAGTLDPAWPADDWRHYLYFNAGWFLHDSPQHFGTLFARIATDIARDPPAVVAGQALFPWLDQVALPLVIHALGGGRPGPGLRGLDRSVTCHWRVLPLFFARASDAQIDSLERLAAEPRLRAVLETYPPFARMLYGGGGRAARALFAGRPLPTEEGQLRLALRRAGLWLR